MPSAPNDSLKTSTAVLIAVAVMLFGLPLIIGLQTLYHAARQPEVAARPSVMAIPPHDRCEWIDRDQGIVRIPIDRAMDLLVLEAREGNE